MTKKKRRCNIDAKIDIIYNICLAMNAILNMNMDRFDSIRFLQLHQTRIKYMGLFDTQFVCLRCFFVNILVSDVVFFVAKISNNGCKQPKEQGTRAKELTIRFIPFYLISLDEKALKTKIAIRVSMRLKFGYLVVYGNAIQLTKATLQRLL